MLISVRGFALRKQRVGEADLLVDVLPEQGALVRVRWHGLLASRRRSVLVTEPGSLLELVYYARDERAGSAKEARVLDRYAECKEGYAGTVLVSHLLDLCHVSASGDESGALFGLLEGALNALRAEAPDLGSAAGVGAAQRLLGFFKVRLARILGVLSDPDVCPRCGSRLEGTAEWALPEFSFLCAVCSHRATPEDGRLARMTALAAERRFANFAGLVSREEPLLAAWQRKLSQCLEHFYGASLRTGPELQRLLGRSG